MIGTSIANLNVRQKKEFHSPDKNSLWSEITTGLLSTQAVLSPKFLYDPLGSKLFEAICELPQYYLTRTEAQILRKSLPEIRELIPSQSHFIDLGAGNCAKASQLFGALSPRSYFPLDISEEFLEKSLRTLEKDFPDIEMKAVPMDFSQSLELPPFIPEDNRMFLYFGSSIGNFAPKEALEFLKRINAAGSNNGSLLIGVDLVKDFRPLESAYNDPLGVTAAFNLNILKHVNELIGADFDLRDWEHRSFFNPQEQRIEMHLQARHPVVVHWTGGRRIFRMGESIHTESSYKYTQSQFITMLKQAGFPQVQSWSDEEKAYLICLAQVEPELIDISECPWH